MARKPTDPTKPTVNKDGKDSYPVHTIGDLVVLYNHLPQDRRARLVQDIIGGLETGSQALDQAPSLLRPLLKLGVRNTTIQWIDDDKGGVAVKVMMREGDEPIFSKEL